MTIRNPLIFDAAVTLDWAMDDAALTAMMEVAGREHEIAPSMLEAYRAQQLERAERATVRDGVAIIDVAGPLFKRANLMTTFCGATAYETVRRDLQAAMDNASVHAILLNIHSPGGEAAGVAELASAIHSFKGTKRIVTYGGDQVASAALWLAVAGDEFHVGPTAGVGSMGVVSSFRDTSAQDKARGIKTIEFVSSQSPYKRLDMNTQDGRDRVQARVDAMAAVFVETVANYRGVSVEHALEHFGKGDSLVGKAAVEAGLADGVSTFEQVLASLARGESPKATFGSNQAASGPMENENMKTDAELAAEAAAAAAITATAPVTVTTTADTAEATAAATAAERKRVTTIMSMILPGYEDAASKAIETGSSSAEFSAMIVATEQAKRTKAAADVAEDTQANAEVTPVTGQEQATGDDAAVNAMLSAFKLATA
jgi:ClpP class serine protease